MSRSYVRTLPVAAAAWVAASLSGCADRAEEKDAGRPDATARAEDAPPAEEIDPMTERRWEMVANDIAARGIEDERVLAAMRAVERHRFVPDRWRSEAYRDGALPIGYEQTISQPYIVAAMSELADVGPDEKVLEIGTGSGYQAAVLGELAADVYTIEIVPELGRRARETLERLGYDNVHCRIGDGFAGWPEEAPFDAVVVTAAPESVPEPLIEQLAEGGRLVIPVGARDQELRVLSKEGGRVKERGVFPVRFVPMTGRAQDDDG